jgi:hypothetical protein
VAALVPDLLVFLRTHRLVESLRVVQYDETPWGKVELKIRCRLTLRSTQGEQYELQVWLHHESAFQDYAYQLHTARPLLRWDNAPHYPRISSAPHHFHDEDNQVSASSLGGNPLIDLPQVLDQVERWTSAQ